MLEKILLSLMPIVVIATLTSSILTDNGKAGKTAAPGETT